MENNEENCEKLAQAIVDGWDLETLKLYAYENMRDTYKVDKEAFNRDISVVGDWGIEI